MSAATPLGAATPVAPVLRVRGASAVLLALASLVGLVAFTWPLLVRPSGSENLAHAGDAPLVLLLLVPLLLAVVLAELGSGQLDAKAVAVLGVLAACGSLLRLPSGGTAGFEPVFFLLLPAGRVLGRGFGFVLGALTLFASALLTAGVGPWLPFQMLAAAWVGFFAGCLPQRLRGRTELVVLAAYGALSGLVYGLVMNLWFWPFGGGYGTGLSFVAGDPVWDNLRRFGAFHLATSMAWDLPRAASNVVLVLLAGRPVLGALRRAARKAAFGAVVELG